MTPKFLPIMFLGIGVLLSCTEQVLIERIVHDTVWIEKPPVEIIETRTDTVWEIVTLRDTVIVSQQIVTTDTIFIEKLIQLVDTVYKEVVKTRTVIEVDTVLVDRVEIVERRLTIVHPGLRDYDAVQEFDAAINEWLNRVKERRLQPKAETIVLTPVYWGPPNFGIQIVESDGIYYAYMEWMVDKCPIWRVLSNVLLDIPLINVGNDIVYFDDWWTGDFIGLELKPHYDHMMFVFFPSYYYDQAMPERQDWYWEDMLSP